MCFLTLVSEPYLVMDLLKNLGLVQTFTKMTACLPRFQSQKKKRQTQILPKVFRNDNYANKRSARVSTTTSSIDNNNNNNKRSIPVRMQSGHRFPDRAYPPPDSGGRNRGPFCRRFCPVSFLRKLEMTCRWGGVGDGWRGVEGLALALG